jgi:hypothetical protein
LKEQTGPYIIAAFKEVLFFYKSRSFKPILQRLDNKASLALQQFMDSEDIDFQLSPPHVHHCNSDEHDSRTFKNHLMAGLCTTDHNFTLNLWDKLLPQCHITLNLLRCSRLNPQLSAQAHVNGAFDYDFTPSPPPQKARF